MNTEKASLPLLETIEQKYFHENYVKSDFPNDIIKKTLILIQ